MSAVRLTLNDRSVEAEIPARRSLADFVRDHEGLTGTHLTCEQGVCGACTVMVDGAPQRSCITLAVACDGREVRTVEGFEDDHIMAVIRRCFSAAHGLQCGYCTPGMLLTAAEMMEEGRKMTRPEIREFLSGNYCRCTGYQAIVDAVETVMESRFGG